MKGCLNIVAPLTFTSETILLVTALTLKRTKHVCRAYLPNLSLCTKHTYSEPEMTRVVVAVRAKGSRSEDINYIMMLSIPLILPVQEGTEKTRDVWFCLSCFLRLYFKQTLGPRDFQPFLNLLL